MCWPRAKVPCPAGIGHQAWARSSRLIDPAPCPFGVATTRQPEWRAAGAGARDTGTQSSTSGEEAQSHANCARCRSRIGGRAALERGEQRNGKQLEDHRSGERVAGNPDQRDGRRTAGGTRPARLDPARLDPARFGPGPVGLRPVGPGPVDVAEQHGVAGPHRDAPDGHAADPGDDGGGVIAAPGTGTRDDQHDVSSERGPPDLAGDRVRVVGLHAADDRPGAGLDGPGGQQEGVAVSDIAGPERRPDRLDLITGRDDRGHGLPGDGQRGMPHRSGSGQVAGRKR